MYDCDRKIFELLKQEGVCEVRVKYDGEIMGDFDCRRVA
jgi:hypothetical protein